MELSIPWCVSTLCLELVMLLPFPPAGPGDAHWCLPLREGIALLCIWVLTCGLQSFYTAKAALGKEDFIWFTEDWFWANIFSATRFYCFCFVFVCFCLLSAFLGSLFPLFANLTLQSYLEIILKGSKQAFNISEDLFLFYSLSQIRALLFTGVHSSSIVLDCITILYLLQVNHELWAFNIYPANFLSPPSLFPSCHKITRYIYM